MSEPADRLPVPSEEHPEQPAAPPAEEDRLLAPGRGLSSGTAAAVSRGALPPASPTGPAEPDPRTGPAKRDSHEQ